MLLIGGKHQYERWSVQKVTSDLHGNICNVVGVAVQSRMM